MSPDSDLQVLPVWQPLPLVKNMRTNNSREDTGL